MSESEITKFLNRIQATKPKQSSQHAWAFPEFIERGGAMQRADNFQCWTVSNNLSG